MRIVFACLAVVIPAASLQAGVISFDAPGDVVLSPNPPVGPGVWYTDRYAPATFESGASGGGRTGVLNQGISAADSITNRPSQNITFYNTQGRKYDLNPGATTLYVDLYVDSAWDALDQSADTDGRLASLWGSTPDFPIIEFNNDRDGLGEDGFRIWDGGWIDVGGFTSYDEWYRIGFEITGGSYVYSVNGTDVFTDVTAAGTSLDNVILQGYNDGETYDIYWDNLESNGITTAAAAVPEPASIWLMTLGGIAFVGFETRRRRKAAAANTSV